MALTTQLIQILGLTLLSLLPCFIICKMRIILPISQSYCKIKETVYTYKRLTNI